METNTTKGALARKLAAIIAATGKVPKTGHNSYFNYDYVTENDLVYAVRGRLAEAGIFIFTSTESQSLQVVESVGKNGEKVSTALTMVTTKHTFIDGDSGEEFSVLSQGQGVDNGDKGGYKAITGAMKYFLYKCFMIPTGDDPEQDTRTDEGAAGGVSAARPITKADMAAAIPPARTTTAQAAAAVPRDPGVDEVTALRAKFEGGKWQTFKIPFGKQKGTALAALEAKSLAWWIEKYAPEPYNGKMNPADLELRAALDVANVEWK